MESGLGDIGRIYKIKHEKAYYMRIRQKRGFLLSRIIYPRLSTGVNLFFHYGHNTDTDISEDAHRVG